MELDEFLGKKYRMVQSEYFDDFLREVGMNWTLRQIVKTITPTIELKKDGENYLIQNYTPVKNSSSLIGTRPNLEYDYETPDGRMVRSTFKIEKTTIYETQKDQKGRTVHYERRFNPTEFCVTNKNSDQSEVQGEGDVQTFKKLDHENNKTNEPITKSPISNEGELQKAKISSKISCVSKSQMKEFREAFRLFDRDGDGSITKEELGRVMRSLGQFARTEELQQMLQEVDVDGDGNVSFEEFIEIAWSAGAATDPDHIPSREEEEKELRDAFRVFDKHNRGYITASDLRAVIQCLGEDLSEEEIEDMIKEVDVDGDGRIDFYEFVNAMGEPGDDESFEEEEDEYTGF